MTGFIDTKKNEAERYREILSRLVDATLLLSKKNLSFRAHRGKGSKCTDSDEGNFIELIKLLGKYDHVMKHHLEFSKINYTN